MSMLRADRNREERERISLKQVAKQRLSIYVECTEQPDNRCQTNFPDPAFDPAYLHDR